MPEGDNTPLGFMKDAFRFCWNRLANVLQMTEMFPAAYEAAQDSYKNITVTYTLRTAKANATPTGYSGACVQNAMIGADLAGLASNKIRIKRVKVQSIQSLDWQFFYFKTATPWINADLDLDGFCGKTTFDAETGEQIAGANQYYYDSGKTDVVYEDLTGTFNLHAGLINRSPTAKLAGATGYLIGEFEYEPNS